MLTILITDTRILRPTRTQTHNKQLCQADLEEGSVNYPPGPSQSSAYVRKRVIIPSHPISSHLHRPTKILRSQNKTSLKCRIEQLVPTCFAARIRNPAHFTTNSARSSRAHVFCVRYVDSYHVNDIPLPFWRIDGCAGSGAHEKVQCPHPAGARTRFMQCRFGPEGQPGKWRRGLRN
jgi:hypothetical protein